MTWKLLLLVCSLTLLAAVQSRLQKPGSCPQTLTALKVSVEFCPSNCRYDSDCPGDDKCCSNICGALACTPAIISDHRPKPGSCPQTLTKNEGTVDCLYDECRYDSDCPGRDKCCSNIYGALTCTPAVIPNRKPGRCPPRRDVGNNSKRCSIECQDDSKCIEDFKCCPSLCGGFVCTPPL